MPKKWKNMHKFINSLIILKQRYLDLTCNYYTNIVISGASLILGMNMDFNDTSLNPDESSKLDVSFPKSQQKSG